MRSDPLTHRLARIGVMLGAAALLGTVVACGEPKIEGLDSTASAPAATTRAATLTASSVPRSSATPTTTASPPPLVGQATEVVSVVDGDTIAVRLDGKTQRVRLILVDTPEVFGGTDCFGPEASAFTKRTLTAGTKVSLEKDVSETDRYGRLLRYVYLPDGRMFNEILVSEGYAQVATFPPDVRHQERFLAAQRVAREARKGLWGSCAVGGEPTATATSRTTAPAPAPGPQLRYDPFGPDRDCGDFATHAEAQAFFIAAGGPASDRHRLDADRDGIACETLP